MIQERIFNRISKLWFRRRVKSRAFSIVSNGYPIAVLGDQVEIHFLHYALEAEARSKWERRRSRLVHNPGGLFVRFGSPEEVASPKELSDFDALPFRHKTIFVGYPASSISSAVWMPSGQSNRKIPRDLHQDRFMFRNPYFDLADWLNGGDGKPRGLYRFTTSVLWRPKEFPRAAPEN